MLATFYRVSLFAFAFFRLTEWHCDVSTTEHSFMYGQLHVGNCVLHILLTTSGGRNGGWCMVRTSPKWQTEIVHISLNFSAEMANGRPAKTLKKRGNQPANICKIKRSDFRPSSFHNLSLNLPPSYIPDPTSCSVQGF